MAATGGSGGRLIGELYDRTWPDLARRADLSPGVRALGERLVGRVEAAGAAVAGAGRVTLVHGDAALRNMRTGPTGEIVLLDWEDVTAAPGVLDLAWLLVSSVPPQRWDDVIAGYGRADGLAAVLPSAAAQGVLSMADTVDGSAEADEWIGRLDRAARLLR